MSPMFRLLAGVGALLLILVLTGFALPPSVTVARSTVINATESQIFPYLDSFRRFNEWSPWASYDPNIQYEFEGPDRGEGARMEWKSDTLGSGSKEIVSAAQNRQIDIALAFDSGDAATARYLLSPAGSGTRLTWEFRKELDNNPVSRWMGIVYDERMGDKYEKGLNALRELVESHPVRPPAPPAEEP